MSAEDQTLWDKLEKTLTDLETDGDIVICSNVQNIIRKIHDATLTINPNSSLSLLEMYGLRSLVLHAIKDEKFFDWEMPTLTGFAAEQFKEIANKLPRE